MLRFERDWYVVPDPVPFPLMSFPFPSQSRSGQSRSRHAPVASTPGPVPVPLKPVGERNDSNGPYYTMICVIMVMAIVNYGLST